MQTKSGTRAHLWLIAPGILLIFAFFLYFLPQGADYYYSFYRAVKGWQTTGDAYTRLYYNPPWLVLLILPLTELTFFGGQAALMTLTILLVIRIWREFLPANAGWAGPISLAMSVFNFYIVDISLRVQIDGFILFGLFLMVVALRQNRPHMLGMGWVFAAIRPTAFYLYGLYSIWVALRGGYLWRAMWIPLAVVFASFVIFGNWIRALYNLWQNSPPFVTWVTTFLRIGSYFDLPVVIPLAVMAGFGAASFWIWHNYAAAVDEPTRVAFLIAASLVTTPYALSYHYSIVFPILLAVLLPWRLWLCIPIYLTTLLAILRVPFGAEVAWVDIAMPILVWILLVAKIRTQAAIDSPIYPIVG